MQVVVSYLQMSTLLWKLLANESVVVKVTCKSVSCCISYLQISHCCVSYLRMCPLLRVYGIGTCKLLAHELVLILMTQDPDTSSTPSLVMKVLMLVLGQNNNSSSS